MDVGIGPVSSLAAVELRCSYERDRVAAEVDVDLRAENAPALRSGRVTLSMWVVLESSERR